MAANPIMENLKVCNFKSRPRILGLNSRPLKKSTMKLPVLPEKKLKTKILRSTIKIRESTCHKSMKFLHKIHQEITFGVNVGISAGQKLGSKSGNQGHNKGQE